MNNRDADLLNAITTYSKAHGYPPTMRELAPQLGVGLTRVKQLMDRCAEKGLITRTARAARCYRVTAKPERRKKS